MLRQLLARQGLTDIQQELSLPSAEHKQIAQERVHQVEQFVQQHPEAFQFDTNGFTTLHSPYGSWQSGRFTMPTLAELKQKLRQQKTNHQPQIRFSVLQGYQLTDILALQAAAEPDVLYQMASQFNCLEALSPQIAPVSSYFDDPTQGPRSALSTFPATLLRHYAAPSVSGKRYQQNAQTEINLLAAVCHPDIARVQAGYLTSQNIANPQGFLEALEQKFDQIQIGLHENCEVALGAGWRPIRPGQLITQAMTSTLAGGEYSHTNTQTPVFLAIQDQLLRAAYLGILSAAAMLGKQGVLLTAIGGGVFENPHHLIWHSILWAIDQLKLFSDCNLEVILNIRNFQPQGIRPKDISRECLNRGGHFVRLED